MAHVVSAPKDFRAKVVGMTFVKGYPDNVYRLRNNAAGPVGDDDDFGDFDDEELKIPLLMRRNPDNEYDANAIEVHAPQLGPDSRISPATMLGHIPAKIAERLAPHLDSGEEWSIVLERVAVVPGKESNPGLHIHIQKVDTGGEPGWQGDYWDTIDD